MRSAEKTGMSARPCGGRQLLARMSRRAGRGVCSPVAAARPPPCCGLAHAPIFCPIVSDFYSGMVVTVPLFLEELPAGVTAEQLRQCYGDTYFGPVVRYLPKMDEDGFLSGAGLSGKDGMELTVAGNDERILLLARYDNLGKGASGAAIQCLNLSLGCEMTEGLVL